MKTTHVVSLHALRKSLYWRIHFWAALIASPFALVATLTGLLYIFTPQIEVVLYRHLDRAAVGGTARPLDAIVAAATRAAPAGWTVQSVLPAASDAATTQVNFVSPMAGHAGHEGHGQSSVVVYVDPATAQVAGSLASHDRFGSWAKRLHSRLLQNDSWRWMIELAASWLMVMLVTGVALWWPRGSSTALPQRGASGRRAWKQWHAFTGVALALVSLVILTTGLTWCRYAGDQIRTLRDRTGQASPRMPKNLQSQPITGMPLDWQAALDATRRQVPDRAWQLTPPRGATGVWRAASVDRARPDQHVALALDAGTGQRLYYADWDQQTLFGKATAIGIPLHRGEFGWWNQALLLVFGLGILFSLVSGWVMFFRRRRPGSIGLPRLLPGAWRSASVTGWITAAVLCLLMPLMALSAACLVLLECAILLRSTARRVPS
ncbi:PepSY-associated TM helix domain-containing protein [Actimicrobium antarcticum]|uniref:PepSY domain-containing protein n=1 Tax=Actimicrobium antarcticum TaxID=1051899 RepID=A0ABP7SKS6_9BURK